MLVVNLEHACGEHADLALRFAAAMHNCARCGIAACAQLRSALLHPLQSLNRRALCSEITLFPGISNLRRRVHIHGMQLTIRVGVHSGATVGAVVGRR